MRKHLASRLSQHVLLQEPVLTPDTYGGYTRTWQDVATLWADIQPLTGRDITNEKYMDARVQARVTHRIHIRYYSGISAEMRLMHEGRALYIRAIADQGEKKVMMEILAEEGVGS